MALAPTEPSCVAEALVLADLCAESDSDADARLEACRDGPEETWTSRRARASSAAQTEPRSKRKADRKLAKELQRQKRAGSDASVGQKPCHLCNRPVDLLIRCTVDTDSGWRMVCGKCWKSVSGGVVDGDEDHPHYRYGGLWKNLHVNSRQSVQDQAA